MLVRSAVLAALAAAQVSAQFGGPPPTASGCTTNSFTIPSWFVQDLRTAGGNATFSLLNRVTNVTANLACQVNSSGLNTCSLRESTPSGSFPLVSLQFDGAKVQIGVNETWTCNDRNLTAPLSFTAVGKNSLALKCAGTSSGPESCEAVSSLVLIRGSLLTPVAISPVYNEGPTGHDNPGCAAAAQNPSWELSTIYFDADADARSLSLLVTNAPIGYDTSCMPAGPPSPTGIDKLSCAGSEFGSLDIGTYRTSTDARFDSSTYRFNMSQTWFCDDVDPAKPVRITAAGSGVLPLNCTTTTVAGSDGDARTTCYASDVTLKGTLISQTALPPYSIEDPIAERDGCTLSSILHPEWTFSAFRVDTGAGSASPSVSFEIILETQNPGFQYPLAVAQGAPVVNETGWFRCDIGPEGDIGTPLWPTDCTMQYKTDTKELTVKADWTCTDRDPDHPILFSGVTTTTVDTPLTCNTVDNVSQCETTDLGYSWTAAISKVSWRSGSK